MREIKPLLILAYQTLIVTAWVFLIIYLAGGLLWTYVEPVLIWLDQR